jgi:hypothetical protein
MYGLAYHEKQPKEPIIICKHQSEFCFLTPDNPTNIDLILLALAVLFVQRNSFDNIVNKSFFVTFLDSCLLFMLS